MGVFGNAFKRELGKNTAKTASNIIFGDRWSTPYRRTDTAREVRAEAAKERAEAHRIRQEAEADRILQQTNERHSNYLNAIDNAVIQNIDQVIAMQFDDTNPSHLCHQLQGLIIQLRVNSLSEDTEEERIRAKYTKAVIEKAKQGLEILLAIDPLNRQIPLFDEKIYESEHASDKKRFKKFLKIISGIAFALGFASCALSPFLIIPIVFVWFNTILIVLIIKAIRRKVRKHKYAYIEKANNDAKKVAIASAQTKNKINIVHAEDQKQKLEDELNQLNIEINEHTNMVSKQSDNFKSDIVKQTEALWEKHHSLHPILERGFQVCETRGHKDILIMRLCANDATGCCYAGQSVYQFPTMIDFGSDWKVEMDMLVGQGFNLLSASTSLNMFSCKEYVNPLVDDIIRNPRTFNYVVDQITVTQNIIEDIITPKVIIVLNKEAEAFFGHIKKLTWMGYTFRTAGDINGLEVCEITGFSNANDRLAQDTRHMTNLIGTKIIFAGISDYRKYPKADQLRRLL